MQETFEKIAEHHKNMGFEYDSVEKKMEYFREFTLGLFKEVSEVMDNVPWKPWKHVYQQNINIRGATEEIVDCLFFLGGMCESLNITGEQLQAVFDFKLAHNQKRLEKHDHITVDERG